MLPFLLAAGLIKKGIDSPVGHKVLGKVGGIFHRKNRHKVVNNGTEKISLNPAFSTISGTHMGIVQGDNPGGMGHPVADKINEFLGAATKTTRELNVTTGMEPKTMLIGAAVIVALFYFMKK